MSMNPRLRELREQAAYLQDELRAIHEAATDDAGEVRSLDTDEDARFRAGADLRDELIAEADALEQRLAVVEKASEYPESREAGTSIEAPNAIVRDRIDVFDPAYQREAGLGEAAKRPRATSAI